MDKFINSNGGAQIGKSIFASELTGEKLINDLNLPQIIFGTSSLGNLYQSLTYGQKKAIVSACTGNTDEKIFFDSAGKYGAGLALETLGKCLKELNVNPENIIISNKLGWMREDLKTSEPTFEPGVWYDLKHDAYQNISYNGILECFEQGNELLGNYLPQFLSVHDPDEYLASSNSAGQYQEYYDNILDAYKALNTLKKHGKAKAIGVGAKDWKVIRKIANDVELDWVMFANCLTVYHHPNDLLDFIAELNTKGVTIINSAVFNGGFLTGSNYFNYQLVSKEKDKKLYDWRNKFYALCSKFNVSAAEACVRFAFTIPGVKSVAINSSSSERTSKNRTLADAIIPLAFWNAMKADGLIDPNYPYI